jgi:hypothetical protein
MSFQFGLGSLVALAVAATPAIAIGQTPARADDDKIVCKRQPRANSRIKDSVCKTRAEWEQMREQQQRDAKEFFDKPKINSTMGG